MPEKSKQLPFDPDNDKSVAYVPEAIRRHNISNTGREREILLGKHPVFVVDNCSRLPHGSFHFFFE